METVIFDGISYVRAATVAKRFKYTTDYVGQLCRNKKVDARLVGRVWYVNLDSVQSYRKGRHSSSKAKGATTNKQRTEQAGSSPVHKVKIKKISVDRTREKFIKPTTSLESHVARAISYQKDDQALLPELLPGKKAGSHATESIRLSVHNADSVRSQPVALAVETETTALQTNTGRDTTAHKSPERLEKQRPVVVSVEASENHTQYATDALPTVLLQGKLSVVDATNIAAEVLEDEDNQSFSDVGEEKRHNFFIRLLLFVTAPIRFLLRTVWRIVTFLLIRPLKWLFRLVRRPFAALRVARTTAPTIERAVVKKSRVTFAPQQLNQKQLPKRSVLGAVFFWVGLLLLTTALAVGVMSLGLETSVENGETATVPFFDGAWFSTQVPKSF